MIPIPLHVQPVKYGNIKQFYPKKESKVCSPVGSLASVSNIAKNKSLFQMFDP